MTTPSAMTTDRPIEPNDDDRRWAAQAFGDADPDWDARLAADANGDRCELCGRPVERGELDRGLCNACQVKAEEASVACQYYAAGLGRRSY